MEVAGCTLEPATFAAWEHHWAAPTQPFFLTEALRLRLPRWPCLTRSEFRASSVSLSVNDTLTLYNVSAESTWVMWLDEPACASLEASLRRDLLLEQQRLGRGGIFRADEMTAPLVGEGLFVWWPTLWAQLGLPERQRILRNFAEEDRLPCCRTELGERDWAHIGAVLPGTRGLAGTFLPLSGGNCLATVVAAFGVPAVAEQWLHPEPFERWLERFFTRAEVIPETLGTVLVWRGEDGVIRHAAVSLGSNLVLHKESQAWYAPRQVTRLEDTLARGYDAGEPGRYASSEYSFSSTDQGV